MSHNQNHRVRLCAVMISLVFLFLSTVLADNNEEFGIWRTVKQDIGHFSEGRRLLRMGCALIICGRLANSSLDQELQTRYQDQIRSRHSDEWAKVAKTFGEGRHLVPVSLVAAAMGYAFESPKVVSQIGQWGQMTARAYLIGGPVLLGLQRLTGGSRPGETEHGSHWRPLKDDNGVSGHAFIGAVPFLMIAHMNDRHPMVKYTFALLSVLPAWSRVNDNVHYPSQAIAGWYLAWEACDAVWKGENKDREAYFLPFIGHDGFGIGIHRIW